MDIFYIINTTVPQLHLTHRVNTAINGKMFSQGQRSDIYRKLAGIGRMH